jgi:sec-independent protein translocase protein TatA
MFGLGAPELLLIFLVVLLLFGGAKLPELARGLGKAIRGFKEEAEGIKREIETTIESRSEEPPANEKQAESKEKPAVKQS